MMQRLTRKIGNYAMMPYKRARVLLSKKSPCYVFHHIPKCGGTSVLNVLESWFIVIRDYRSGHTNNYPDKVNLERLRSAHCLCGHFELPGYFLQQRYPEVLLSDRYRVFSMIRDPLSFRLSHYRHLKDSDMLGGVSVNNYLGSMHNVLASCFCATESNYQSVLDRYFLLG